MRGGGSSSSSSSSAIAGYIPWLVQCSRPAVASDIRTLQIGKREEQQSERVKTTDFQIHGD